VAQANGPSTSTATVANTTAFSDGTSAVAGSVGAGMAFTTQGTTAADSSAEVRADGTALTNRISNTIDTLNSPADLNSSAHFAIAVAIQQPRLLP
jgi:hypothetical protein